MASAPCASTYLLTSLANTTAAKSELLKPCLSSSISTPRSPKKLTKRKNHLRTKILKTLTIPFPIEPIIPVVSPPEQNAVDDYEPPVDEIEGIGPVVEEAEEIRVLETEGVAGEYSGGFGKFSAKSVLRIGLGLVAVFMFQTICTAWVLGGADSDEKNKNTSFSGKDVNVNGKNGRSIFVNKKMVHLDKTLEDKINEIRVMAREAREIEGRKQKNGEEEGGILGESENSNGRIGIEKEIGARLIKVEKKLKSRNGKLPGSYTNLLNESQDEDEKEEDKTLVFKKKFKFRRSSMSLRSDVKGFSSSEGCGLNEKKKSAFAGSNGDSRANVSGMVELKKSGSEASGANSNYLQNDTENLEKMLKEMGVGSCDMRFGTAQGTGQGQPVEVEKSRKSKNLEMQYLQNFMKESQETPMKSNKDDMLGGNGRSEHGVLEDKPSANVTRASKSDMKPDLWWSNLPYVLTILMRGGLKHGGAGGFFILKIPSEVQDQSKVSYTVAFEDRVDANNFCYILESYFEGLSDFSADIVPLPVKELLEAVKSNTKEVLVVKKGQLKLYAGQPLEDVEKALHSLVEQNTLQQM